MRAALGRGMDALLFEMKRGQLSAARMARRALKPFELTPARFDLMNAIGAGARQCDLWRRLNVVRSVVSEMIGALLELGWVRRVRAADSRTWLVSLTRRGHEVFERAYQRWVDSGDIGVHVDAVLVNRRYESDPETTRAEITTVMWRFIEELGWSFHDEHWLYRCDIEDYYFLFADETTRWSPGVPFVS